MKLVWWEKCAAGADVVFVRAIDCAGDVAGDAIDWLRSSLEPVWPAGIDQSGVGIPEVRHHIVNGHAHVMTRHRNELRWEPLL
jgi:hypothetical protein